MIVFHLINNVLVWCPDLTLHTFLLYAALVQLFKYVTLYVNGMTRANMLLLKEGKLAIENKETKHMGKIR